MRHDCLGHEHAVGAPHEHARTERVVAAPRLELLVAPRRSDGAREDREDGAQVGLERGRGRTRIAEGSREGDRLRRREVQATAVPAEADARGAFERGLARGDELALRVQLEEHRERVGHHLSAGAQLEAVEREHGGGRRDERGGRDEAAAAESVRSRRASVLPLERARDGLVPRRAGEASVEVDGIRVVTRDEDHRGLVEERHDGRGQVERVDPVERRLRSWRRDCHLVHLKEIGHDEGHVGVRHIDSHVHLVPVLQRLVEGGRSLTEGLIFYLGGRNLTRSLSEPGGRSLNPVSADQAHGEEFAHRVVRRASGDGLVDGDDVLGVGNDGGGALDAPPLDAAPNRGLGPSGCSGLAGRAETLHEVVEGCLRGHVGHRVWGAIAEVEAPDIHRVDTSNTEQLRLDGRPALAVCEEPVSLGQASQLGRAEEQLVRAEDLGRGGGVGRSSVESTHIQPVVCCIDAEVLHLRYWLFGHRLARGHYGRWGRGRALWRAAEDAGRAPLVGPAGAAWAVRVTDARNALRDARDEVSVGLAPAVHM
mmetsp:Transcript_7275/g.15955  ORF Transcript_7275/g.15955 Transcript_7275/m.15955 type:complete len:538 (+) Transcript_7275:2189-3802(+)